jgi:hypothetical protein
MKKRYEVFLSCYELVEVTYAVDAESEQEAARLAIKELRAGKRENVIDSVRAAETEDRPDWKEFRVLSVMT